MIEKLNTPHRKLDLVTHDDGGYSSPEIQLI